jgi:hypothetical protein
MDRVAHRGVETREVGGARDRRSRAAFARAILRRCSSHDLRAAGAIAGTRFTREAAMPVVDRLFRFLSVAGLWLIAAMLYVLFFHEGGQLKLPAPPPQSVNVNFPAKLAVTNADGAPLRIVGEVTLPQGAQPATPKVRLNCKLTGSITTAQPSFRLFSGEWKPDRDWPVSAKLECETAEFQQ